jgi:hypothetical protein
MNLLEELPQEFNAIAVFGDVEGYLEIYSMHDDETLLALLEMAIKMITSREFSDKTTPLH